MREIIKAGKLLLCLGLIAALSGPPSLAETINLDSTLQKAITASYDLQIARKDVDIVRTDITAARADYFPQIQARANAERLEDLQDIAQPAVIVGNNLIPSGTRYQSSINVSVNQQLLDFGVRRRRVRIAKREVAAKEAAFDMTSRDMRLKVVDLYTNALTNYKTITANQAILSLAQEAFQMKKRLNTAGTTSNVEVATEAIQVAQAMDDIEEARQQMEVDLQNLSYYTGETYDPLTVEVADITVQEPVTPAFTLDLNQTADARFYDAQIESKQAEIEMHRRQYLPQLSAYSYYNLYGFDPDQIGTAFSSLRQRTIQGGLSIALPIFDGLKNKAAIDRAQAEKEKLALQKTKALAELQHKAQTLSQEVETQLVLYETRARILNKTQDKLTMEIRLSERQVIDKTLAIQDHIARIRRQVETEKTVIQKVAAVRKLRIMEGGI